MRVLHWHVHGAWSTAFVQGDHDHLVPVVPCRGPDGRGRARTYPWPDLVLAEVGSGGRSRRVNVLVDGRGLIVDCEAHAKDWTRLEPAYNRVMTSFTVSK